MSITIDGNSVASNRVTFDDLSWTCYSNLGVEEFGLSNVKIHPNPAHNNLHIDLNTSTETHVQIYSLLGQRVLQRTIQNSEIIELNQLSNGVYILRLTQDNNTISKKLIKN